jgi:4-methyl-5(b-hydroxyethyl)-thiazole monophosphate biosynthesis
MTKRVLLLLADGFELLEAAGFTDVLGWANVDGEEPIELVSAGLRSPLRTTFGFAAVPDASLSELDLESFDAVAIPGGFEKAGFYQDALSEPFLDAIRAFTKRDRPVASVCVASLALGASGVVHGRRATTYHQLGGTRKAQLESYGATFVDEPVVVDGQLISSTGPGTGVEVAFELLAMLTSQKNADHVRTLMRVPFPSSGWRSTPQVSEEEPRAAAEGELQATTVGDVL